MFFWFKLKGINDTFGLIKEKAVEQKVFSPPPQPLQYVEVIQTSKQILLVPGSAFSPNGEKSPYVRAAFSTISPDMMDEALKRLAKLIREASKM